MTYIKPAEVYTGQSIYAHDWNRVTENQQDFNARLLVLEAATPPEQDFSAFPVGGIVAFAKPAAQIPTGWVVCDGTNGTPDLRGAFIYGAADDTDLLDTGGTLTHTHTNPNTNSAGSHTHSAGGKTGGPSGQASAASGAANVASAGHTHNISFTTASGGTHTHTVGDTAAASTLPPYVKLYFIMYMGE
jgi:hypothetical protein